MRRVKRIVKVHAGQDRKHVSLQTCDEEFEGVQRHTHAEGKGGAQKANTACGDASASKSSKQFQKDVAREHVREETQSKGQRTRNKGNDLNRDQDN